MDWISVKERLPTARDADAQQCVLAWHRFNGAMTMGWHQVEANPYATHWMPLPPPPEGYTEHYRELWRRK